jgi:hypothetical protein
VRRNRALTKGGGAPRIVAEVARHEEAPEEIALGDRYVYFVERTRVMRAPKAGGAAEVAAQAEERVRGIAAFGERVVWAEGTSLVALGAGARRVIGRVSAEGRVPIALDADDVAFVAEAKVWRVRLVGGAPEALGEARAGDARLAARADTVAWTEPGDAGIAVRARTGAVARTRFERDAIGDIAIDDRFVFVSAFDTRNGTTRILRVDLPPPRN